MKNKKTIFALFVALVCVFTFSVSMAVCTAYAEPLVYEYFSSKENCSVTYSKNKGWKIKTSNNSQETYMFTLNKSVLSYYVNKGYTNLEITFGNAFDDVEYAGVPVNCKAWVLPAESGSDGNYVWDYVLADRGFSTFYISGWNVRGEGRYSITVDLTNARYDFVNYGITFYLESKDVLGNFVGACFIHSVEFSGVTEEAPEVPENAVKLEKGAQVRMVSPIALGFVSRIDYNVYNNLKSTYGEQNVVVGTAIVSQKELLASGAPLTVEDLDLYGLDYDNCIAKTFINSDTAEADGYYRFRAVKYIDSGYLTEKYAALSYIKVTTVLGNSYYYYSDFSTEDNVRTAQEVSSLAYSDLASEQDEAYDNQVEYDEKVPENAGKYSPYKAEYREFLSDYLTARYFVENGESSYKIVISQNATEVELLAAEFLKEKIAEATGADMPFVYDTETAGVKGRYISIGQNKLLEDAGLGSLAEQTVCDDGYIMKTVKNTLFIDGIIDRGTLYGVYDFLEQRLNYLLVSSECYTFIPTKNLEFCEIDVALSPTFTSRTYLEFEVMQGYTDPVTATFRRTNNFYLGSMDGYGGKEDVGYVGYDRVHNMQETIIEGVNLYNKIHDTFYNYAEYCIRYTNDNEHYIFMPCLTSGLDGEVGVLDFVFVAMKKLILEKYPLGIKYYSFTQEDSYIDNGYCTCNECNTAEMLYGRSGLLINFMNALADKLSSDPEIQANAPDFHLFSFAYHYTKEIPKVSPEKLRCNDNVAMMICLNADNAFNSLFEEGYTSKKILSSWGAYCNDMLFWGYDGNFAYYLDYYPTTSGVWADNVLGLKNIGATTYLVNGLYNADNLWFAKMHAYVFSRLAYNFDYEMYAKGSDAYVDKLVKEYLRAYYGESWLAVYNYVTYYMDAYEKAGVVLSGTTPCSSLLSKAQHKEALALIDKAIEDCTNPEIIKRLYSIKATNLAVEIINYTRFNGNSKTEQWKADAYAFCDEFTSVCQKAGLTVWRETGNVSSISAYIDYFKRTVIG